MRLGSVYNLELGRGIWFGSEVDVTMVEGSDDKQD